MHLQYGVQSATGTYRALERFPKRIGVLFRIVNVQQRLRFRFGGHCTPRRCRVQRDRLAAAAHAVVLRIIAANCSGNTHTHVSIVFRQGCTL